MRKFFTEFCDNSTIHGIRYFTERRRHWSERFWWIITFGLSFWLCGSSIHNIWLKWNEYPVVVRFTEKDIPISSIPFPTVTICPQTKFLKDKLDFPTELSALRESKGNISSIALSRMEAVLNLCPSTQVYGIKYQNKFSNASIYETIKEVAPSLNGIFFQCRWQGTFRQCSTMFTPTFTQDGFCFAFNALNSHEMYTEEMSPDMMFDHYHRNVSNWDIENGYIGGINKIHYPERVHNAKKHQALYIYTRLFKEDLEYLCTGIIQGFKITLTMPGEMIHTSGRFYEALLNERTEILMKPKMITTSQKLRNYESSQRLCFYSSERRLRFFKIYTKNNCEAECVANFTKFKCECVKFSMPRDNTTKICGLNKIECYRDAEKTLFSEDLINGLKDIDSMSFRVKCNCLPACTNILYDADIDRSRFDWMSVVKSMRFSEKNVESIQPAVISIYFVYPQVMTIQRAESNSLTDFLATCGGLLGLFLGVSMLSLIEFVYYSTLRLFWTIRQSETRNTVTPFKREMINSIKMDYASRSDRIFVRNPYKVPMERAQFRSRLDQLILAEITPKPSQIEQNRIALKKPVKARKIK